MSCGFVLWPGVPPPMYACCAQSETQGASIPGRGHGVARSVHLPGPIGKAGVAPLNCTTMTVRVPATLEGKSERFAAELKVDPHIAMSALSIHELK